MIASMALWFFTAFGMFDPGRFYTPREVWKTSHAPRSMVYESLERGDLRALRRGSRWLIPGSAAIAWLSSAAEGGDAVTNNGSGTDQTPDPDAAESRV